MRPRTELLVRTGPTILPALIWLYMIAWAVYLAIPAFDPDAGGWGFEGWVITMACLLPVTLIPVYLVRCMCRSQPPLLMPWLPWVVRIMYVSIFFAMCDSWIAGTDRHAPLFSYTTWKMKDGGTIGSVGFGYSLPRHRAMGGEYGPEVWFWFTPFTVCHTSHHIGLRGLWQSKELRLETTQTTPGT